MLENIMDKVLFSNSVRAYLMCVAMLFAGFIVINIFRVIILKRLKRWAEKTATTLDDFIIDVIRDIAVPMAYMGILYLSLNALALHPIFKKLTNVAIIAFLTVFVTRLAIILITYGFDMYLAKQGKSESLKRSMTGILRVTKLIVCGLALTFFLDNMGFRISAVIAGLGIGGVAVALAAQAILGDLFSYFSILFDRPFEIGDFIIIGDYLGSIEHIGIKTTRIRSLGGEQLIFSNTDLTSSRVRNYKRMDKRRVVFKLGVTYQTFLEHTKAIPGIITKIIKNVKDTVFNRAHFLSYGDFNLIFEVVYYVMGPVYNKYMDIQQEINFAIKEEFEKQKIEFAYPTQTLYVNKAA